MPKLTDAVVAKEACRPPQKDKLVFDSECRGFGLRVASSGAKTFLFQYAAGTQKRRMPLGRFGEITTADARKRALVLRGMVTNGADPVGDELAAKLVESQASKAAEVAAALKAEHDAFTVSALVEWWGERQRQNGKRPGYVKEAVQNMRRHLVAWLDLPASGITPKQAALRLDEIAKTRGGTTANRLLSYSRAAWNQAQASFLVTENPWQGRKRPKDEVSRDRALSGEEVGAVWRGCGAMPARLAVYGDFMRVLLLTLGRRSEVAGMRWNELSDDMATWTLPGERAKNGKAHVTHLTEPVRAILQARRPAPEIVEAVPYVFAAGWARGGRAEVQPVMAFAIGKAALDEAISTARLEAGQKPAELPGWCLHDFRRSGVTALADMGFAPHVCDRLLNHIEGTIRGVAAVYQKAEFMGERKAALEAWSACVLEHGEGKARSSNVVRIGAAA